MDFITAFFLSFSHAPVILSLIVIGYLWVSKRIFYHALCLMGLSILLNIALKGTFQIPLAPALGKEGFAFPSGHMQLATVLYGWLALHFRNRWFRTFVVVLLLSMGFSLVHAGYHDYNDVLAGVFVAGLLVLCYRKGPLKYSKRWSLILWGFSTALMLYIHWISKITVNAWMAYSILLGILLLEKLFETQQPVNKY